MSKEYIPTRKRRGKGSEFFRDRSVMLIVQQKKMAPREFWAHIARLPLVR